MSIHVAIHAAQIISLVKALVVPTDLLGKIDTARQKEPAESYSTDAHEKRITSLKRHAFTKVTLK